MPLPWQPADSLRCRHCLHREGRDEQMSGAGDPPRRRDRAEPAGGAPSSHSVSARIAMTRRSGGQQTRLGTYANGSSNFATVTRHRPTTRTAVRESRPRTSANSSPLQRLTNTSPVRPAWQPGGPTGLSATKAKQPARMTTPNTQATATAKDGARRYRSCKRRGNVTRSAGQPSNGHLSIGQRTSQDPGAARQAITSISRRISLPGTRWTGCARPSLE
jgi:hypothetical protein